MHDNQAYGITLVRSWIEPMTNCYELEDWVIIARYDITITMDKIARAAEEGAKKSMAGSFHFEFV